MTAPPTWRLVLFMALPVMAQNSLSLIITLSDGILGGMLSEDPNLQAAQTQAHYLQWSIGSYLTLATVGATALVARAVGAGDMGLANRATHQSLLLAVLCSLLPATFAACGGFRVLLTALNLSGEAVDLAVEYLNVMAYLLVFNAVEATGIACLIGAADTRTGFWVMVGVVLFNLPLVWGLAFGAGPIPALGFVGISLGTSLAHAIGAAVVTLLLLRGRFGLRLDPRLLVPDLAIIRRLLRVSVPAALDALSVVAGQLWFLSIVNHLGNVAISAHGISLRWEALGYLSGAAFGTAASSLVGQNLGALKPAQAERAGWLAFYLGCAAMTFMGVVFFVLSPEMFLISTRDSAIVEAGVPVLRVISFAMPPLAATIIFTSALRGAGDTRVPVLFTWTGFFLIRIPLAYFLAWDALDLGPLGKVQCLGLGLYGCWLAMVTDLFMRGIFFFGRFWRGKWKSQRV